MQKRMLWLSLLVAAMYGCGGSNDSSEVNVGDGAGTGDGQSSTATTDTTNDGTSSDPGANDSASDADLVGAAGAGAAADLPAATAGSIPEDCRGFDFEGLIYSPGGTDLPNKCEAFHPTLNNPYAVRCIDAWSWYDTGFPGDEYCILPPPPDKGVQVGHHPQGLAWFEQVSQGDMSGYEAANIPGDWTLPAGAEEERNINVLAKSSGGNFYRSYVRMRAGSHHMIVSITSGGTLDTWERGGADGLFGGQGIPGAQRPDQNAPRTLEIPPEDVGLYRNFPADPTITYNMHHFNSTSGPILKEAWENFWWVEEATTPVSGVLGLPFSQVALPFASPGQTVDKHYYSNIAETTRVLSLFGHRHAWTTNFSSWVERQGGETEVLYQSFDWFDQPTFRYDSQTQNPEPNPEGLIDGGASGVVMLNPGDQLHFNCHIAYTDERAAAEGAPLPAEVGTLGFANEAFTGEMCILFGETALAEIPLPVTASGAPPAFATAP
ncbi:MAG: hypothetical protein OEZ06_26155 [Myxococcales bacterium]|nr:hypothetical protein [Myxococcales bacterium]